MIILTILNFLLMLMNFGRLVHELNQDMNEISGFLIFLTFLSTFIFGLTFFSLIDFISILKSMV